MKLQPFLLDQWLSRHAESPVEFNLGGSTGPRWTLRELMRLAGEDACERLLDTDVVYSPSEGGTSLRQAIGDMHNVPAEQVLVVAGGSEALLHLFFLAAEPGANVIVPFPGFPPYHALPQSLGLDVRTYRLTRENGYRIDLDEVKRLADASTKLLLVNSPHNPTGATLSDEEMRSLHDFAAERGIQFVSDEVFHPIYHGPDMAAAAGHGHRRFFEGVRHVRPARGLDHRAGPPAARELPERAGVLQHLQHDCGRVLRGDCRPPSRHRAGPHP